MNTEPSSTPGVSDGTLLDAVLPEYEFSGREDIAIHAPPARIFRALREVTLADMPLAHILGEIRYLPSRLAGRLPPSNPSEPFWQVVNPLVLAEEPEREIVIGGIAKYHNLLDQQFVWLEDAAAFAQFDDPDYQKLAQSFRVVGGDEESGYTVSWEHRTHALSAGSRRKFALYWWLLIRPGSAILLRLLLGAIRRRAEGQEEGKQPSTGWLIPVFALGATVAAIGGLLVLRRRSWHKTPLAPITERGRQ